MSINYVSDKTLCACHRTRLHLDACKVHVVDVIVGLYIVIECFYVKEKVVLYSV